MRRDFASLILIFFLALTLRFLYFPENIYFGFDQARDGYAALDILKGDLKIIGPSTAFEGLYHGVLYYYLAAPLYFIGGLNPEIVSAFFRIFNATGVFLIFFITSLLFNKKVGLFAAILYASSFEQTQLSIYLGHPSLGVLTVLFMYLGFALIIFKKKYVGLLFALLGFGFSIQSEFVLTYLIIPFLLLMLIFKNFFLKIPLKIWLVSLSAFIFSLSSFIVAEIKYNFRTIHGLIALSGSEKYLNNILNTYFFILSRIGQYNIVGEMISSPVILISLFFAFIFYLKKKEYSSRMIFLGIWFFSILATVLISGGVADLKKSVPLYYQNVGVSLALLIFVAFIIDKLFSLNKVFGVFVILIIILTNFKSIQAFNPKGTISEINVQQGMLLSYEKKVLDYIYNEASGKPFAVKAVTMPYFVNTTWSYLFEWYGKKTYGYLPIWSGKNAPGYYGNLEVQTVQEQLPSLRFLIIEPTRGIAPHLIEEYIKEENYFTKVMIEKKIGEFIVQRRVKF